jgi:hypothetical protein
VVTMAGNNAVAIINLQGPKYFIIVLLVFYNVVFTYPYFN